MSDDAEINSDPDENRAIAAAIIPIVRDVQTNLTGFALDIGKWIMTSLLAINGAGVLAVWPSEIPTGYRMISCGIFLAGMIAAMLSGYFGLKAITRVGEPLGRMLAYLMTVQADGVRSAEFEDFSSIEKQVKSLASAVAGWTAVVLFLIGAVTAGFGGLQIDERDSAPDKAAVAP